MKSFCLASIVSCNKKLVLNHYVTKSRTEFLSKYKKGKLSQASKEVELSVDRAAFVEQFGDAFIEASHVIGALVQERLLLLESDQDHSISYQTPINCCDRGAWMRCEPAITSCLAARRVAATATPWPEHCCVSSTVLEAGKSGHILAMVADLTWPYSSL